MDKMIMRRRNLKRFFTILRDSRIKKSTYKSHNLSKEYRDFCKRQLAALRHPVNEGIRPIIGRRVKETRELYQSKINMLKDPVVAVFDEFLQAEDSAFREKYGSWMFSAMKNMKDNPEGIFVDLMAYDEVFNISKGRMGDG